MHLAAVTRTYRSIKYNLAFWNSVCKGEAKLDTLNSRRGGGVSLQSQICSTFPVIILFVNVASSPQKIPRAPQLAWMHCDTVIHNKCCCSWTTVFTQIAWHEQKYVSQIRPKLLSFQACSYVTFEVTCQMASTQLETIAICKGNSYVKKIYGFDWV